MLHPIPIYIIPYTNATDLLFGYWSIQIDHSYIIEPIRFGDIVRAVKGVEFVNGTVIHTSETQDVVNFNGHVVIFSENHNRSNGYILQNVVVQK